ncbi:MAG: hypothetical protein H7268_02930 [Sandarakinorhabdus sp.]|nr:hypothetical protein [Sandarakinorhabdus sp.]
MLPDSDAPVATRLFARSLGAIPGDFGAIAVILFPNDAALDQARMAQVCKAFVAVLGDATATAAVAPHRAQMVTVWPVMTDFPAARDDVAAGHGTAAVAALCPPATAQYDFITAERVRRRVPVAAQPASGGRGPFLVAGAPARRLGDPRSPMLTYDLSGVEGQARLTRAMKLWKEQIEERPQLWSDGWDPNLFRLEVSSTVDAVGAQIGSAMKLVPWLGGH